MNINATLLGQMITFAIFVWFTMKMVWPMLDQALVERKKKIADGLAAAEQGHKTLEEAKNNVHMQLRQARKQSADIINNANQQALQIIEEAKAEATQERNDIVYSGHKHVDQALQQAKVDLQKQVAGLVIHGVEKILSRTINASDHKELLDNLSKELY
jgi:F-type H+-transporting ATPase subunit b